MDKLLENYFVLKIKISLIELFRLNLLKITQEKSACITIHKMNEYLDDGPIFLKKCICFIKL